MTGLEDRDPGDENPDLFDPDDLHCECHCGCVEAVDFEGRCPMCSEACGPHIDGELRGRELWQA